MSIEQFPNCHMYGELALHSAAGIENLGSSAGPGVRCKSALTGRMRMNRNDQKNGSSDKSWESLPMFIKSSGNDREKLEADGKASPYMPQCDPERYSRLYFSRRKF
jgi:hypothetical protein